jgi:aryl-alcohol dehydrogenase-like predicted oxidoreductase
MAVTRTRLGRDGPEVSRIGLGCMEMSDFYGSSDERESVATIHAAMEHGITLLDTGDFYGMGHNELLIARALRGGARERAFIQVKFGAKRDPNGRFLGFDASPAAVKTSLAYTLRRLGTDHVDLYQPARLDRGVPIEDTVGAIAELVQEGHVRHIGLSEVSAETIRRAHAAHPISQLQIEYSLITRTLEGPILDRVRELGIGVTAYGVLSRGLISESGMLGAGDDQRGRFPRLDGANLVHNRSLLGPLERVADELGATVAQLAIAWTLSRGEDIIPLIGARTRARLAEALGSLEIVLDPATLERVDEAIPIDHVRGERYDEHAMASLNSESPGA